MKTTHWVAALALVACGKSWAHDGQEPRPHTHWYLEMDPTWYTGAALGQGTFDDWKVIGDDGSFTADEADDKDVGWRLFAGVDLGRHFAVELGFADVGEATHRAQSNGSGTLWNAGPQSESVALEALDLTMVGKLPLAADWALFASAGYLQCKSTFRVLVDVQGFGPFDIRETDDRGEVAYGGGVQYDGLRPLRVAAAYRKVSFDRDELSGGGRAEVQSVAISLAYLF